MKILITTDAFPPTCGGSGWSTHELARGLRARGHHLTIVQPVTTGSSLGDRSVDGFAVRVFAAPAPALPYVRNYYRNERLYRRLAPLLRAIIREDGIDVVHAQHAMSAPPSVAAARAERVPVVCTIRDYWPVCYWSDLIHDYASDHLCPQCSAGMMTRCVRPRAGAAWPAALPFIPYMRGNLARKQRSLGDADALVAVSARIGRDLAARAPALAGARIEVIPNPIDVTAVQATAQRSGKPMASPYAVYVGKLSPNKGVMHLVDVLDRADLKWPLVVVGDGGLRQTLEAAARRAGRDVRFTGWIDHDRVLAWIRHASVLIFPSFWEEPLSRVLIEATALGTPIAAMDTGGTREILTDEVTALLSRSPADLAARVVQIVRDPELAARLGRAARAFAETTFATPRIAARVEALYAELARRQGGDAATQP